MNLDNSYAELPERFFETFNPAAVPAPTLLAWNRELAEDLGLGNLGSDEALAQIFSGNALPDGSRPLALAYAGHQFGQFVPRLGDGRAVLLGDIVDRQEHRFPGAATASRHWAPSSANTF